MRAYCGLLAGHFIKNNVPVAVALHVKLNLAASLNISVLPALSLERAMFGDVFFVKDCVIKLRQRFVAS